MPGFDNSSAITVNGVFPVWDESTSEDYGRSRDANFRTRVLRCNWSQRHQLVQALQSGSQQIGTVTIITAAQLYPGSTNLYVDGIHIDGEGEKTTETYTGGGGLFGVGQLVAFDWAVLTVKYTPMDFTVSQTELDFGKEIVSYSSVALQFDDGHPVGYGAAFPVSVVTLRQTRYNVPALPVSAILNATTSPVNSQPIFGAAPGTVLFDGGRSLSRYSLLTPSLYDIAYCFLYKPIGWGKLFNPFPATGSPRYMDVQTTDGTPLLARSDLNALFL